MQWMGESVFAEFVEPPLRLQDHTLRDLPFHPHSLAPPQNHQNRQNHRPHSLHHHCLLALPPPPPLLHRRQVVALPVLSPLHLVHRSHQQTRPHRPSSGLLIAHQPPRKSASEPPLRANQPDDWLSWLLWLSGGAHRWSTSHMTMVASAARWEPLLQGGFHPRRWLPLLQGGFHRSGRKDINPIPESGERLTFAGRLPLAK